MFKFLIYKILFIISILALSSCAEKGVEFIAQKPEQLKSEKMATFYGDQAKAQCEIYRRVYAGFCDTTSQPYVTCHDINEKKLKNSSCNKQN